MRVDDVAVKIVLLYVEDSRHVERSRAVDEDDGANLSVLNNLRVRSLQILHPRRGFDLVLHVLTSKQVLNGRAGACE